MMAISNIKNKKEVSKITNSKHQITNKLQSVNCQLSVVNCQNGQTLIEAVIALAISVVIISAIAVAVISSLNNAQFSKNQNQANQYAREGIDVVRAIRDSSWSDFTSYGSQYCLGTDKILKDVAEPCEIGIFYRQIDIEHDACTTVKDGVNVPGSRVTSTVSWSDSKCKDRSDPLCHKVKDISCFTNLNQVPTP